MRAKEFDRLKMNFKKLQPFKMKTFEIAKLKFRFTSKFNVTLLNHLKYKSSEERRMLIDWKTRVIKHAR